MSEFDDFIAKHANHPVTFKAFGRFWSMLKENLAGSSARLHALEQRIVELEKRPSITYDGVYTEGKTYHAGQAVTHGGSLWIAKYDTMLRPGTADSWQLAAKRGRGGRELGLEPRIAALERRETR